MAKYKSDAQYLINIEKGVFVDFNKRCIYMNTHANVPTDELHSNTNEVREAFPLENGYLVKHLDVLGPKIATRYEMGNGSPASQYGNTSTILGMNPAYTICDSIVQVWRNWTITVDGKAVWHSTDNNGDKTISVTLNGTRYNLPAYRVLAIGMMVDASELDKFTYDYLCELIYGAKGKRSNFEVHHINGNHHDNKGSNLAILHKNDHRQAHKLLNEIAKAAFVDDNYAMLYAKRRYLEFVSIHSSYDYIVNNY